jgi:hypothetical protein
MAAFLMTYQLEPLPEGTRLRSQIKFRAGLARWLGQWAAPLLLSQDWTKMKRLIEEEASQETGVNPP